MTESPIKAVFGNPMIFNTLGSYLTFREFTDLRSVSRLMKTQVDGCELFRKQCWKTVFMLPSSPEIVIPQDESSVICRNIKVILVGSVPHDARKRQPKSSSEIFPSMQGLKISQFIQLARFSRAGTLGLSDSLQHAVESVLSKMPQLEIFAVNALLMSKIDVERFGNLRKIQKIIIFRPGTSASPMTYVQLDRLNKNMEFMSKKIKNLKHFVFVEDSIRHRSPLFSAISSTLLNNIKTLHFLEILQPEFWKTSSIANAKFPSLSTVKIRAIYESRHIVERFLENQPLLEHLKLSWKDYFPKSVYDLVSRKSSTLRTLHVKGRSFGPEESRGNWEFLKDLQYLEDFEIKCPQKPSLNRKHEEIGFYESVLEFLPSTIRRLHFRGLASDETGISNSALFRFQNLKEIRLLRCKDIFDNNILQTLLSNQDFCSRIKTFEFSHCDTVTDSGLIGPYGHSINNMKELRRLTVKRCPNITDAFLDLLMLPHLTFLDVSSNKKLQQQAIASAAVGCPNLEILRSSWKLTRFIQPMIPSHRFIKLLIVEDGVGKEDEDSGSD